MNGDRRLNPIPPCSAEKMAGHEHQIKRDDLPMGLVGRDEWIITKYKFHEARAAMEKCLELPDWQGVEIFADLCRHEARVMQILERQRQKEAR